MKLKNSILALLMISTFCQCQKDNDNLNPEVFTGKIVDIYTKVPLAGVHVQLIENGPEKVTDSTGEFHFSKNEALSVPGITTADLNASNKNFGISILAEGYLPKEENIIYLEEAVIEIIPDNSTIYYYHKPVQIDDGILTSSLWEENMDTTIIQNLMNKIVSKKYRQLHSLLVYRNGKLILEEYYKGNNDTIQFENNIFRDKTPEPIQWSRNGKHYVASVNKALTSSLVGIALNKFGKSVDDKVSAYLPGYASYFTDANKNNVSIENCLTMTAGFNWDEWGKNDLSLLWKSDDFASFLLNRENKGPHFEWRYCSASPNLLIRCLDNIVGGSIRTWADENFYAKLGITDYNWGYQPGGLPEGAARMFVRPRDMLKIGVTYLDHGMWNGELVIPAAWVENCFQVKEITGSGNYSYFFWLRKLNGIDYLSAEGDGGNYINIFPSLNMVIVITQGNYLEWPLYVNQADDMMKNFILPAAN